jgi:hypothetical protein
MFQPPPRVSRLPSATLSASASGIVTFMRRSIADRRRARPPRGRPFLERHPGVRPAWDSRSRSGSGRRRPRHGCGAPRRLGRQRASRATHPASSLPSHRACVRRQHCPSFSPARGRAGCRARAGRRRRSTRSASAVQPASTAEAGAYFPLPPRCTHGPGLRRIARLRGRGAHASAARGTRRPGNASASARHDLSRRRRGAPVSQVELDRPLSSRRSAPRVRRSRPAARRDWPRRHRSSAARSSGRPGRR